MNEKVLSRTQSENILNDICETIRGSENGELSGILNKTLSLSNIILNDGIEQKHKIAFEYIANISRVIKNTFNGDASEVDAFVASIELADSASEAARRSC